jgi:hypothetical protein
MAPQREPSRFWVLDFGFGSRISPKSAIQDPEPSPPVHSSAPRPPSADAAWQAGLDRFGLGSLAGPLGDLIRPVAWLGAQALLVLQPTVSLFGGGASLSRLVQFLEDWDSPEEPSS